MNEELLKCPFCGKTESLVVGTEAEIEEDQTRSDYFTVCCSALRDYSLSRNDGGCGAMCGYYSTREEAIEKWNRRAE